MNGMVIRGEDKNRWERRAPLIPEDVAEVRRATGAPVWVEHSEKRFFREEEYRDAGALPWEDRALGRIVLGIKEVPEDKLLPGRVYLFFSHTIKGQEGNMPMLRRILDGGSTLIDYERITDAQGRRLVYFGNYAGDAGALDILWLLGEHWRHRGAETPFSRCRQAIAYRSVDEAKEDLRQVGREIHRHGLPGGIHPLVIGVLGYGNVSQGAQQIFECLPVERVAPEDLAALVGDGRADPRKVYLAVFQERHLVRRRDGGPFDLQGYFRGPEEYESRFGDFLPHLTVAVNAVYWEPRCPRFITWDSLAALAAGGSAPKLAGIADITCDVNGSVECTVRVTDIGSPAYRVDPRTRAVAEGHLGEGIVVLAVDNLPAELPADASAFFSGQLRPFLPALLDADFDAPLELSGLPPEIQRAVIAYRGSLTPAYEYLASHLR
ncbi:MAG: hypothetical protein IH608_12860 [Proteobacteria bacterium]|nr:hypothetical protein [Pseudomonadota bacterium]